jgi:hypothetical protein
MNNARRKKIKTASEMIIKAQAEMLKAKAILEEVRDDEKDAYENLSDGQKDGDRGSEMQENIDSLYEACDELESFNVDQVLESLAHCSEEVETTGTKALSSEEMQKRRMARLPAWAKSLLQRSEAERISAEKRLEESFGEQDPENPDQMVVDDYVGTLKGKTLPCGQILFPFHEVRVTGDGKRGIQITAVGFKRLAVFPESSNSIRIKTGDI